MPKAPRAIEPTGFAMAQSSAAPKKRVASARDGGAHVGSGLTAEAEARGRDRTIGGPDVFLDSYAAIPRAARCSLIVFQPSALLIFSSRYHTM